MEGKETVWVSRFLKPEYFSHCNEHVHDKVKDTKYYCVNCLKGPLCETGKRLEHGGHCILQVRKASNTNAIRVSDIVKLLNITDIQMYSINGSKIVFLPSRPQAKPAKGAPSYCEMCHRSLHDQVFCSLSCKLKAIIAHSNNRSITFSTGNASSIQQKGGYNYQLASKELLAMSERAKTCNKGLSNSLPMLLQVADGPAMILMKIVDDHLRLPYSPTSVLLHHDHHKFPMPSVSSSPVSTCQESSSSHNSLKVMSFRKRSRSRKGVPVRALGVGIIPVEGSNVHDRD